MPVTTAPVQPPLRIGPVIHRTPRAVMLATTHPLATCPSVDIEELADHDTIYPELPDWFGQRWVPSMTPDGRPLPLRRLSARYIEDVLRLVSQGTLAHLTFTSLLSAYQRPGVVVVPLTGLPPMPIRPVWPDGPNDGWARQFAAFAGDHAQSAGWLS
jgi:DNA-binding transcriptional LysR family regulator